MIQEVFPYDILIWSNEILLLVSQISCQCNHGDLARCYNTLRNFVSLTGFLNDKISGWRVFFIFSTLSSCKLFMPTVGFVAHH